MSVIGLVSSLSMRRLQRKNTQTIDSFIIYSFSLPEIHQFFPNSLDSVYEIHIYNILVPVP